MISELCNRRSRKAFHRVGTKAFIMKKHKLTLSQLKVKSFLTTYSRGGSNTVKGGSVMFCNTKFSGCGVPCESGICTEATACCD